MDNSERRKNGLLYNPLESLAEQAELGKKMEEYNSFSGNMEKRIQLMQEMFGSIGERCWIEPPVRATWGCRNVHLGNGVYCSGGVTLYDDNDIFIGDGVLIGPNVVITTAGHPISTKYRNTPKGIIHNFAIPIHIGSNVWIGANAVILPGVTIGDNSVIAAGSVVVNDIPANVVAVGVPCRVIREINEVDDIYYFKDRKIDIEVE